MYHYILPIYSNIPIAITFKFIEFLAFIAFFNLSQFFKNGINQIFENITSIYIYSKH